MCESPTPQSRMFRFFKALGPAVIVASVVLGPGSILSSSKVGAAYGFGMIWVLVLSAVLMMGMVALGASLGVSMKGTMCDELASRLGRPFAVIVGLTIFFICTAFQFGNNLGVLAAIDPWLNAGAEKGGSSAVFSLGNVILLLLNAAIIVFLFAFRKLYKPIERMMMVLVGLMIMAFFGNFIYLLVVGSNATAAAIPKVASTSGSSTTLPLIAVIALVGTTFSVAGAFYQAYLVREKGWGLDDVKRGLIDSVAGVSILGAISLVIMLTAAISFYGRNVDLKTAADVSRQLDPLFGSAAVVLFSLGLFAGAFSSFMVNAMIGGAMLSDGFGLGGKMDSRITKAFTTVSLLVGMIVAISVPAEDRVGLVVFAQAMVVIGLPLLAISMLYLAIKPGVTAEGVIPLWMKVVAAVGVLVVVISARKAAIAVAVKIALSING